MSSGTRLATSVGVLLLIGCSDNPVTPTTHDDENEPLTAQVAFSTTDVYTLSGVEVDVVVMDHHGTPVTDLGAARLEFKRHEDPSWAGIDLTRGPDHFHAEHIFVTSGEFEMRVMVQRHGETAMSEAVVEGGHAHLEIHRAFQEMGGARVEFETFPGHVHEGQEVTGRFWIMERELDHDGHHHGIHGLSAEIHCLEPDGHQQGHIAEEREEGVYEAHHTFESAGSGEMTIHFPGDMGAEHEATFSFPVVEAH